MKTIQRLVALLALAVAAPVAQAAELTGSELLVRNYESVRHPDATAEVTMTLRNKSGQERVRKLVWYTKLKADGRDLMTALYFRSPADIKGTATLLIEETGKDDGMWIYLPALKKTRRLMSDNKRDSFVGSDLSYGEIIGHRPSEWNARVLRNDTFAGRPVVVVEALPKTDAVRTSSGYAKRELWLDRENFVALKADYWDDTGAPLKTVVVGDVRPTASGRYQFMRVDANNQQSGHSTQVVFDSFQSKTGLADSLFTVQAIERGE